MRKFFFRIFVLLLITVFSIIIYFGYFGINTDKFDVIIKSKANEVNQRVKLDFKKTKIHLNIRELNLAIKLQNPKILVDEDEINLSKLDLFLALNSFFTSDFLLKRAEVAFSKNDIKDLIKVTKIFIPRFLNKKLNKIFAEGNIEGKFIIPFETNGDIGKDYGFSGKVSNALIVLTEEFSIKNLTTEIVHEKNLNENKIKFLINEGLIYDLNIANSLIDLVRKNNETKIKSSIQTYGKFNFSEIKKILSLLDLNNNILKDADGKINLKTNIDIDLDNRFKLKNTSYSLEGVISHLAVKTEGMSFIKEYLPEYDSKLAFKDASIKFINSKLDNTTEISGFVKIKDQYDKFIIKEKYNYKDKNFNFNGTLDLKNSKIQVDKLNYYKESGENSEIDFDINFVLDKYYNIKELIFSEADSKIFLSNIKLNKNFEVKDFKKLKFKTFRKKNKNNDFVIEKSDKITISGKVFDAQPLLKSLYKSNDKRILSKKFSSKLKINFDKTLTGTNDDIFNFSMIASINKGAYEKLSLKGNFSEKEIVEMSIYQVDKNKKTLQVISDRARPFVKNFQFIKGFEGGKLEYESTIFKEISNSKLTITDFKVSKVPALAKLLTLASLQGIADTLNGDGIRFDSFEMTSESKDNILNIEDVLAMGPAVSIIMEGYVDKGKTVSLRGTLVPATKLNAIIASIPIIGDILVGQKTGEGVVGVSFKMKGPPKDIKTTVNPIKTLTPRFIVRTVEKMKKKKEEEKTK